ncbi:MAG: LysR family transcriptional regulator [Akkermansiaceae bacterium]|nr:LysR family transcriptional regulator [Akkermansiaceae bacterium]
MNIHHLELFYHVARAGGVSAAARQMPYGIQQPAISAQILQLENSLGKTLFHRRPFQLTAEGETLFAFIDPFFSKLTAVADRIRGGADHGLRIACPEIVQRDYLPTLLTAVRKRLPDFHFSLHSGRIDDIKAQLRAGKIDLGLATSHGPDEPDLHYHPLLRIPSVLLLPESAPQATAAEILALDRIDVPLITLPQAEPIVLAFQEELQRRKIEWFPMLELAGMDLIERFVAGGYGAGLVFAIPGSPLPPGLKALPLEGFPEVAFSAITAGPSTDMAAVFVREAEKVIDGLRSGKIAL